MRDDNEGKVWVNEEKNEEKNEVVWMHSLIWNFFFYRTKAFIVQEDYPNKNHRKLVKWGLF